MHHYAYRVFWSPEDKEWVGLVAEFPSLSWLAPSAVEAITGIEKLVMDWVADMVARGEEGDLPVPLADGHYSGQIPLRIPPYLHRRLAMEAAQQNFSTNEWISWKLYQS